MLIGIRSDPETGLFFLRILIDRLRVITRALEDPHRSLNALRQAVLPKFKASDKISIGFSSLSSCGGCAAMLVRSPDELGRITDKVRVRYCPILMDQEQILEMAFGRLCAANANENSKKRRRRLIGLNAAISTFSFAPRKKG